MLSGIEAAPWCNQSSKQAIKQSINMHSLLFNFKPFTHADSRLNLVGLPSGGRACHVFLMFAVLVHVGTSCLYVTGGPRTRSSCQQGSASTTRTARPPGNTSGATTSRVAGSLLPRQRALTIACSAG